MATAGELEQAAARSDALQDALMAARNAGSVIRWFDSTEETAG
jgi:hypothetical protein